MTVSAGSERDSSPETVEYLSAGFGLSLHFASDHTVMTVRGDLDALMAPAFGAFLDIAAAREHGLVVLDFSELSFFDASALGQLARILPILRSTGGDLIITSPPAITYKALEITGFTKELDVERPAPKSHGRQSIKPLPAVLAEIATDGVDGLLVAALMLLVVVAQATVERADGASVSLAVGKQLQTVAASNEIIAGMDADQYSVGEGPCVSAATLGTGFHIVSVASETRWPTFTPLAAERGINSVISTPLSIEGRPVGALNIYSRSAGAFDLAQAQLASLLARQASTLISAHAPGQTVIAELSRAIEGALAERRSASLAQGILMEHYGLSADAALEVVRNLSRDRSP
jgi:anti-anti-sigma factor